jgi:retron-type reverse transcriptase
MMQEEKTKSLPVSKRMVYDSYLKTVSKQGGAGIDRESIEMFNANMSKNLYKIYNRMASGSYFPPSGTNGIYSKEARRVKTVGHTNGRRPYCTGSGKRLSGAYSRCRLLHSSFGYRPGRSAHHALVQCQTNCIRKPWVLDVDIKGFFDNISHSIMLDLLGQHTQEKWVLMYVDRWLIAGIEEENGSITARTKGTPQGGVVSPCWLIFTCIMLLISGWTKHIVSAHLNAMQTTSLA